MIMAGTTLAMRPIGIIGRVLLARILAPNDFGLVALALLLVDSSSLFVGLGMEPAIIHSDLDRHKVAFHSFVLTTISSVTMTLLVFSNSAWLASFLGDPAVAPILQVLSINLVIGAWKLVPSAIIRKNLMFGAVASSNLVSRIAYLGVAVVLALLGFGVWSLVLANVAQSLVAMIVMWWLAPNKYWLKPVALDLTVFKSLLSYGLRITGSGIVRYFAWNADDWLVGRQLGATALGFYSKAFDFTNQTMRQLAGGMASDVLFPTYTKIRDNTERLKRAYVKSVQFISTLMFPVGMGFLATASMLIPVVLGEQWIPMVTTFQIFSILLLTRPVSGSVASIFWAVGKPQLNMYAALVLLIVMVPAALLLIPYGIAGVAVAVLLADVVGLVFNFFQMSRVLPGSTSGAIKATLPSLLAASVMFVIVTFSLDYLQAALADDLLSLGIAIVIGVAVYGLGILLTQREFTLDVASTAIKAMNRKGWLDRFSGKKKPV